MLRYKTETWFSRLIRHPVRKRSGSILTTPEPARGETMRVLPLYAPNRQAVGGNGYNPPNLTHRARKPPDKSSYRFLQGTGQLILYILNKLRDLLSR